MGLLRDALFHFEQAAQAGNIDAVRAIAQVRQQFGMESALNPAQQAFEALQRADSFDAMQQAVQQFPILSQMILAIEQVIEQQVPPGSSSRV